MLSRRKVADETQMALELVESNTVDHWAEAALAAIFSVCQAKADFISDDVWATGLESTHNDRALGPVMMRAKKLGYCEKTDRVRPSLRSHLSGKPVWRSLLWQPLSQ